MKLEPKLVEGTNAKLAEGIKCLDDTSISIMIEKHNRNESKSLDDQKDDKQTSQTEPPIEELGTTDLKNKDPKLDKGTVTEETDTEQRNSTEENATITSVNRISKIFPIDFKCDTCTFSLENEAKLGKYTRTKLRKHYKNKHFICEICREKCENIKHLRDHMLTVHIGKEGEMFCGVKNCDRKVGRYIDGSNKERSEQEQLCSVIQHRRFVHDNMGIYVCKICNSTYKILKEHRLVCNTNYDTSQQLWKKCIACHKKFKTDRDLIIHEKKIHLKIYSCNSCSYKATYNLIVHKEYQAIYNLIIHKAKHQEGKVICEKDGCSFVCVPAVFKRHLYKEHGEGKVLRCNFCDYKTFRTSILAAHEAGHAEFKDLMCSRCDYKTSRKDYMTRHESKHQETPKYFCDQCEYKSWDHSNFQVHIKVKHGSDIHKCQECNYQSKSSRSLRMHKFKHNHAGSAPYS